MDSKAIAEARIKKIREDQDQEIAREEEMYREESNRLDKALDNIRNLFDSEVFQQRIISEGQCRINIDSEYQNDTYFSECVMKIMKEKSNEYMNYRYDNQIIFGIPNYDKFR